MKILMFLLIRQFGFVVIVVSMIYSGLMKKLVLQ